MELDIHLGFLHTDGEFIRFGGDPGGLILFPFIVQELLGIIDTIIVILVTDEVLEHIIHINLTEKHQLTQSKKIKRAFSIRKRSSKQKIKTRLRINSRRRISSRQKIKIKQQPNNRLIRSLIQRIHKPRKNLVEPRRRKDKFRIK